MNELKELREIHVIREIIFEETKNMTPRERAQYANKQAEILIKEYNLKIEYKNKTKELV
jgi:hypothetical protein